MIAVDTNILIYAHRLDSAFHDVAAECVMRLAEQAGPWGLPWPCVHEVLAVVTNPRIFDPPTDIATALAFIDELLRSPRVVLLAETETHWQVLRGLIAGAKVRRGRVHDARIAAICLQHGVREFWSADRDVSRFPQLRVVNPLVGR